MRKGWRRYSICVQKFNNQKSHNKGKLLMSFPSCELKDWACWLKKKYDDNLYFYQFDAPTDEEAIRILEKEQCFPDDPRPITNASIISRCRATRAGKQTVKLCRDLCQKCFNKKTSQKESIDYEIQYIYDPSKGQFSKCWEMGKTLCYKISPTYFLYIRGRSIYWNPPKGCPYQLEHFLWYQEQKRK